MKGLGNYESRVAEGGCYSRLMLNQYRPDGGR
jgi:hypothetical protein